MGDAVADLIARLEAEHAEIEAALRDDVREYRERYGFPERLGGDPFSRELHRRASVRVLVDLERRLRGYVEQARVDGKKRSARDLERQAEECRELIEGLGGEP